MKAPLKVYLGDLSYDTVSLSTNGIPLNIGYIGSFCKEQFGSSIEVVLFKYINELEQAILTSPPDLLGLGNYCWNQNLGHEMFRLLHQANPDALSVFGGPNFPKDRFSQEIWLDNFPEVDIYVPLEGEVGFANIVEHVLAINERETIKQSIFSQPISGCIVRGFNGRYHFGNSTPRLKHLDEIPSPYLTGLMDEFFDGRLDPHIQTSRGCPFTCAFCVDGSDLVNKVNRFSVERSVKELTYIAEHVPSNLHTLSIQDLNFGMFRGDLEICDAILETQKKYNYPRIVGAATGKNAKDRIIAAIRKLGGSLKLTMAVQSMDDQVLKNIRRENISEKRMMELAPTIKESGLQTKAEVILGLPGESYDSHLRTLRTLLNADMDEILVFTCMLLPGSELFPQEEREKWGLKTKHRILPRDFCRLSDGTIVIETEECVVASDSLTFDEYVELRLFNFVLAVTNTDTAYSPLKRFLKEQNIEMFELVSKMFQTLDSAPDCIQGVCNDYRRATVDELWDSPEEIFAHYKQDAEYQKLLNGEAGINVLYHHQATVLANYMKEWTDFVFVALEKLLSEQERFDGDLSIQFADVANYSRGISFNPLGKNRMATNPKYEFYHDVREWLNDSTGNLLLAQFRSPSKVEFEFRFTNDQFDIIQDQLERFDDSIVGTSTALLSRTIVPSHYLWRKPFIMNQERR